MKVGERLRTAIGEEAARDLVEMFDQNNEQQAGRWLGPAEERFRSHLDAQISRVDLRLVEADAANRDRTAGLRFEMLERMGDLRAEFLEKLAETRAEFLEKLAETRAELLERIDETRISMIRWMFTLIVGQTMALASLIVAVMLALRD
jgi:hypothetical protein